MNVVRPLIALAVFGVGALVAYQLLDEHRTTDTTPRAWGYVDTRTVNLAFERTARIEALTVEEGDRVKAGQVLGRLDTTALTIEKARLNAQITSLEATLALVKEGPRAEDIAAARAQLAAAEAQYRLARLTAQRQDALFAAKAGAEQRRDEARQTERARAAEVNHLKATLEKLERGARPQEITVADSNLAAAKAQLAAIEDALTRQSVLVAPRDARVRSRLVEPGELASPNKVVYRLTLDNPKWVRAYLTEARLNEVHVGDTVSIRSDTGPVLTGKVTFVSDTAEFTPKTVQTEELRTALVYEFKVDVDDPQGVLKLGQPVTVDLRSE